MMIAQMPNATGSDTTFPEEEAAVRTFGQRTYRTREQQLEEQFNEVVEAYSSMAYN